MFLPVVRSDLEPCGVGRELHGQGEGEAAELCVVSGNENGEGESQQPLNGGGDDVLSKTLTVNASTWDLS